jgi:RNA-binding protein
LTAAVQIGKEGLNDAVIRSAEDVLRTRELIKVALGRHTELKARDAAAAMAVAVRAEVVQVIGRTFALYRKKPDSENATQAL